MRERNVQSTFGFAVRPAPDLARQTHRVLVYTFMVPTLHTGRERHSGFSEAIAQLVSSLKGTRPALLGLRVQQVELTLRVIESGGVYSEQPNTRALDPISPEQAAYFREDLVVQLRAPCERTGACNGVEIG